MSGNLLDLLNQEGPTTFKAPPAPEAAEALPPTQAPLFPTPASPSPASPAPTGLTNSGNGSGATPSPFRTRPETPPNLVSSMNYGEDPADFAKQLRFSMRAGDSAMVAVLQETLARADVHYIGTYVYCLGHDCPFCQIKEATPRYLAWILKYITDSRGQPIQPLAGEVKTWLFGRDKYAALTDIQRAIGDLRLTDIRLTCTEDKFQRFTITQTGKSLWLADKAFAQRMIDLYNEVKKDPIDLIARYVSHQAAPAFIRAQAQREATREAQTGGSAMHESGGRFPSTQAPSGSPLATTEGQVLASTQDLKTLLSQLPPS